jgi:hypothetical protein
MMVALGANAEEYGIEGALHAQEILDRMDATASVLAAGYYFRIGDSPGGSPLITARASYVNVSNAGRCRPFLLTAHLDRQFDSVGMLLIALVLSR